MKSAEATDAPLDVLPSEEGEKRSVNVKGPAVVILAVIATILALRLAQGVLVPIVLAMLISYALEPLMSVLGRLRVPRVLAAALLLCGLVAGTSVLVYQLRFEVTAIATRLPEAARRVRQQLEQANRAGGTSAIQQVQKAATELDRAATAAAGQTPAAGGVQRVQVEAPPTRVTDYLMSGSYGLIAAIGQAVLVLFMTFFFLASGDLYRRKLVKIVGPSLTRKKVTVRVLEEIDQQIERFLLIQVFTSTVVGLASWLAFRWVGLEQAGIWGLLAGIFNSIPYFGPVIVTSAVALIAFMQFGALAQTVAAASLALLITTLEGMLLTPWLTSRASRMNGVAVFVGLLFWGWLWNVWGVLLAVPMLMAIKTICDHVEDLQPLGELLGD